MCFALVHSYLQYLELRGFLPCPAASCSALRMSRPLFGRPLGTLSAGRPTPLTLSFKL